MGSKNGGRKGSKRHAFRPVEMPASPSWAFRQSHLVRGRKAQSKASSTYRYVRMLRFRAMAEVNQVFAAAAPLLPPASVVGFDAVFLVMLLLRIQRGRRLRLVQAHGRRTVLAAAAAAHIWMDILCNTAHRVALQPVRRLVYQRPDYKQSSWWRMLQDAAVRDAKTKEGKQFRRRFRLPFQLYADIVVRWEAWFPKRPADITGRNTIPVSLLILGVLRVLGRGNYYDDVAEVINCDEETVRIFFLQFCQEFCRRMYDEYVHPSQDEADVRAVMDMYRLLGFPGAVGSMDCTHVRRDMVPAMHRNYYVGKEGFPTAAFEVTVDYTHRIHAVTVGYPGSWNDKTIVRFDGHVRAVHERTRFGDVQFDLCDAAGNIFVEPAHVRQPQPESPASGAGF